MSAVVNLMSLGSLAAFVVLAIWAHQATQATRGLRRPTAHSPAAGWFVPVVNLWFPYQAVRDLLPPGHGQRGRVGWWWACYLGGGASSLFVAVVAIFDVGLAMR